MIYAGYLFEALSFLPHKDKPDELLPFVCQARNAVIEKLLRPSEIGRAFLITTSPLQAQEWQMFLTETEGLGPDVQMIHLGRTSPLGQEIQDYPLSRMGGAGEISVKG